MFAKIKAEKISPPNSPLQEPIQDAVDAESTEFSKRILFKLEPTAEFSLPCNQDAEEEESSDTEQQLDAVNTNANGYITTPGEMKRNIRLLYLLKNCNRLYGGLEYVIEFQNKNSDDSEVRYYCELCQDCCETNGIVDHCKDLIHLFRYIKALLPIEYSRIMKLKEQERCVSLIKKLVMFYNTHTTNANMPKLQLLENLTAEYYNIVQEMRSRSEKIPVEFTFILSTFNETETKSIGYFEDRGRGLAPQDSIGRGSAPQDSILNNIKRCNSPVPEATPEQSSLSSNLQSLYIKSEPKECETSQASDEFKLIYSLVDDILKDVPITIQTDVNIIEQFQHEYLNGALKSLNEEQFNKVLAMLLAHI